MKKILSIDPGILLYGSLILLLILGTIVIVKENNDNMAGTSKQNISVEIHDGDSVVIYKNHFKKDTNVGKNY